MAASIFNAGSLCGGRATRGGQTEPALARYAVLRRPLLPSPPRGSCMPAHPRSTVAVARQAQGAPSTADGPAPPRSVETHPKLLIQVRLASEWNQWTSTLMPNLINSPTKHCAAVIHHRRTPFTSTASDRL